MAYQMHANLAFTDCSSAMVAVAMDTDVLGYRQPTRTSDKRTLVLSAALLTAFVECIAM